MKTSRSLQLLTAIVLAIGSVTGNCQIQSYYYSGPVNGYTGVDLSPGGIGYGGFSATFGTISETLYYDPAADTLEQVGSVTVSPSSSSFDIQGGYLNPADSGSATLVVGTGGSASFDITSYNVSSGSGPAGIADLLVPINGSGTFNGQPFSGSWNIDIPMTIQVGLITPASLTFSESYFSFFGGQQGQCVVPGIDLYNAVNDGTYSAAWQLRDAVATAVPEPGSLALLALGLSALALRRRR